MPLEPHGEALSGRHVNHLQIVAVFSSSKFTRERYELIDHGKNLLDRYSLIERERFATGKGTTWQRRPRHDSGIFSHPHRASPAPRLQHVRFVQPRHGQALHCALQVFADFK
jgi:hypothetical protein